MLDEIEKFKRSIEGNVKNKDYGMVRDDYLVMSSIFLSSKNQIERLKYDLLAVYIDLSGMRNNNTVEEYELLDRVFETNLWKDISIAKKKSKLTVEEFLKIFSESVSNSSLFLPFSYFDIEIMQKIIITLKLQ